MFETLFLQILNMSFTASFVIVAVIVARLLLKKAPRVISYALWAVVLFRLICPFSFESAVSLLPMNANPIPQGIAYQQTPQINTGIPIVNDSINAVLPAATPDASMNPLQGWLAIGTLLWLCGIAVLVVYSVVSLLLLKRRLHGAICENENVYLAEGLASPFVMGLFRPKIYLPANLTDSEKQYILLHEQTHIKRLDHVVKIMGFAVLCLHWFNPLAWLAFFLCCKDMEMSCDEAVIKRLGSEVKKDYSSSLLALATGRRIVGGSPLAFGEGDTKSRIKNVLNYKKPAFWVVVVSIIAVVAVGVGLISNPKQARSFVMTGTNLSDLQPENIVQHIAGITMVDAAELEVTEDNFGLTVSSDFSLVNSEAIRFVFSNRQNKPQSAQLRIFLEDSSFFVTEPVDWVASKEDMFKLRYYLEALKYLPKEEIASLCKVSPERYAIEIAQGDRKRDPERCIYFDKDGVTAEQSWRIRLDIMPLYGDGSTFNGKGSDTIHLYYSEVADTAAPSSDLYSGLSREEYEGLEAERVRFESMSTEEQLMLLESGGVSCSQFEHLWWEDSIDSNLIRFVGMDVFRNWVNELREQEQCSDIYSFAKRFGLDYPTLESVIIENDLTDIYPLERLKARAAVFGVPSESYENFLQQAMANGLTDCDVLMFIDLMKRIGAKGD